MDLMTPIQILDKAVCISFYTNALGKVISSSFSPLPTMFSYLGRLESLDLV